MRKRNIVIILAVVILVALGLWLFVFRNSSKDNNQDNNPTQSSAQPAVAKACDVFSVQDAKNIFGNDLSQVPSPDGEGTYTPPSGIKDAPAAKTVSSSCMYTKGSLSPVKSPQEPGDATRPNAPAPQGNKNPVSSTESSDELKKELPEAASPPQILANITLLTSTVENAKADFNRAKPKNAKEITGLGDSAFTVQVIGLSGKKGLALTMVKGKTLINITGDGIDINTAKKIAGVALSKL